MPFSKRRELSEIQRVTSRCFKKYHHSMCTTQWRHYYTFLYLRQTSVYNLFATTSNFFVTVMAKLANTGTEFRTSSCAS
eukprot:3728971-Rhodomonas_salina.2